MREEDLQKEIAVTFSLRGHGRLWVNDNGFAYHKIGDQYKGFMYGLGPGSSDLIGFTVIDGQAIFTAIEVKLPKPFGKNPTEKQENFLQMVRQNGGLAGVARSWEDVERIMKRKPTN